MKNEALDLVVLTAVRDGANHLRTIVEHLTTRDGRPGFVTKLEVENSLRRLRAAGKLSYGGQVKGWSVVVESVSALN